MGKQEHGSEERGGFGRKKETRLSCPQARCRCLGVEAWLTQTAPSVTSYDTARISLTNTLLGGLGAGEVAAGTQPQQWVPARGRGALHRSPWPGQAQKEQLEPSGLFKLYFLPDRYGPLPAKIQVFERKVSSCMAGSGLGPAQSNSSTVCGDGSGSLSLAPHCHLCALIYYLIFKFYFFLCFKKNS